MSTRLRVSTEDVNYEPFFRESSESDDLKEFFICEIKRQYRQVKAARSSRTFDIRWLDAFSFFDAGVLLRVHAGETQALIESSGHSLPLSLLEGITKSDESFRQALDNAIVMHMLTYSLVGRHKDIGFPFFVTMKLICVDSKSLPTFMRKNLKQLLGLGSNRDRYHYSCLEWKYMCPLPSVDPERP